MLKFTCFLGPTPNPGFQPIAFMSFIPLLSLKKTQYNLNNDAPKVRRSKILQVSITG